MFRLRFPNPDLRIRFQVENVVSNPKFRSNVLIPASRGQNLQNTVKILFRISFFLSIHVGFSKVVLTFCTGCSDNCSGDNLRESLYLFVEPFKNDFKGPNKPTTGVT